MTKKKVKTKAKRLTRIQKVSRFLDEAKEFYMCAKEHRKIAEDLEASFAELMEQMKTSKMEIMVRGDHFHARHLVAMDYAREEYLKRPGSTWLEFDHFIKHERED